MNAFRLSVLFFAFAIAPCLAEDAKSLPTTVTVGAVIYSNVTWGSVTPSTVVMFHQTGAATIPLEALPSELQQRLGYDPRKAAEYRAALQRSEAARQEALQRRRADAEAARLKHTLAEQPGGAAAATTQPAVEHVVTYTERTSIQGHPDLITQYTQSDLGFTSVVFADGTRSVSDLHTGEHIEFDDRAKTAVIFAGHSNPEIHPPERTVVQRYMDWVHEEARDMGPDRIDDRVVEKYSLFKPSVTLGGMTTMATTYTIWIDKTQIVCVLEESTSPPNMPPLKATSVCSNFQYNPKLPANELSLDPPLGYKVTSGVPAIVGNKVSTCNAYPDIGAYVAKHAAAVVHDSLSAKARATTFSADLNALSDYIHLDGSDVVGLTADTPGEGWFALINIGRSLADLPKDSWAYPGAGHTRGNPDDLIFWCKTADGYQGIYGNLSVKNLGAHSLPTAVRGK